MIIDVFQFKLLLLVYFSGWMAGGTIEVIIMLSQLSTKLKLKLKLSLAKTLASLRNIKNLNYFCWPDGWTDRTDNNAISAFN